MRPAKARRLPLRVWGGSARRAWLAVCACLLLHGPASAGEVATDAGAYTASYHDPTFRYGHRIMGDVAEWGRLCLRGPSTRACVTLPDEQVFEDMAPRLADLDGDGEPEVIAVESDIFRGAALVVYRLNEHRGLDRIATPPIGTRYRWLAPLGAADLDGDGVMELAYVDRPHLAKTLRIWRYEDGALTQVASASGFTNHRIGEEDIAGGIRDCGAGPEMILASGNWSERLAVTYDGAQIEVRRLGTDTGRRAFARSMACSD